MFWVKKKGGDWHPVCDFRGLNKVTENGSNHKFARFIVFYTGVKYYIVDLEYYL